MEEDYPKISGRRRPFAALSEQEIFSLARQKMEDEKRFLDPYLTLDILAEELNVHRNALSAVVNRFAGMAFPSWVATYRIAEAERLAALPENHGCGIKPLALRSGFSNRNTFSRVYTALRQGPPSERLPGRKKPVAKKKNNYESKK